VATVLFSRVKFSRTGARARRFLPVLAICLMALSASGETAPSQSSPYQALPLRLSRQNHLLVRVFINDKPALLGVDSGAPVSGIALKRRKHFGLTSLSHSSDLPVELRINGGYNPVAIAHH
jgi:hypothetical protein